MAPKNYVKNRFITCEVCGARSSRRNEEKRMFMAKFPYDEARCKQWVKNVGKEDLVYVPIEKLHTLKYVCQNHFSDKAFNKKKNRLRRTAVPMKNLINDPLPDEMLNEFPCRIALNIDVVKKYVPHDTFIAQVKVDAVTGLSNVIADPHQTCNNQIQYDHSYCRTDSPLAGTIESTEFEKPTKEAIFSWQKKEILDPTEDSEVLMCGIEDRSEQLDHELGDVSLYDEQPARGRVRDKHDEYQCNVCQKEIVGFRYTCLQCCDWDLCGACEANGAHHAHYVLRVPGPRPYNEIQAVLAVIRQQLLSENLFLTEQMIEDSLKSEPADEPSEAAEPAAEPDPLQRLSHDARAKPPPAPENEYSDGSESEYRPPRRKRRRRSDTSSGSDDAPSSHTPLQHKLRTKPATRSAVYHPGHATQLEHTEPSHDQTDSQLVDALEIPGAVYQVPGDICAAPGTISEVNDNVTVFKQELSASDVAERNLEEKTKIVHLRVPPHTDDAALAQALKCRAFVALQPLRVELQNISKQECFWYKRA